MNLFSVLVLILIGLAIYIAVRLLLRYGFLSWEFWFGGIGVVLTAALFLLVLNKFGISMLQTQARGVVGQTQNMFHDALPNLVNQSEVSTETWFGVGDGDVKITVADTSSAGGGSTGVEVDPVPQAPPKEGDTQWAGNAFPSMLDPYVNQQFQCLPSETPAWILLARQGNVPANVSVDMESKDPLWRTKASNEEWTITFTAPLSGVQGVFTGKITGIVAREIKSQYGGWSFQGDSPWPLIIETYRDGEWRVEEPFCP